MSDLVVGEAVVLELRLAKLASRTLAVAIDLTVEIVLLVVASLVAAGVAASSDEAAAAALELVVFVAVVVGYPVTFESLSRGRSLGKLALGLRVVREDGGPIRFRHALVRGLLGFVEFWITFGSLALITSLASSRGKRVGDYLAGTVVIRERVPAQGSMLTPMPIWLAGWAATLDLGRLPDDLALAARQFLARYGQLAPEVRDSLGARLADAVVRVTAPPPPPGTPSWAFLAAVLAERRRRETARLMPPPPPGHRPFPAGPPPAGPPPAGPPAGPGQQSPRPAMPDRGDVPVQKGPFAPPG